MTAQWLLEWHNLIFVIPFALALVYLGLYTLSGWTFGDPDLHADLDADADADVHVDADAGVHVDASSGAHVEHDPHHANGHNGSAALAVLSFFGLGRAPLSLLLMILLMTWGVIGFAANTYARDNLTQLAHPGMLSIPLAAVGSLVITKLLAGLIGRYLPMSETYARRRHDLLGSEGELILPTDHRFGMVAVRDNASGELFHLPCRIEAGERTIAKGTRVKLVAYNADEKLFFVIESEFPEASRMADRSSASSST